MSSTTGTTSTTTEKIMTKEGWTDGLCTAWLGRDCQTFVRVVLTLKCCTRLTPDQMGASFCTTCLFGRAAQRLKIYPSNDSKLMDTCNSNCWLSALSAVPSCCLYTIPTMFKREEVRERFNIKGNLCEDCLVSLGESNPAQLAVEMLTGEGDRHRVSARLAVSPRMNTELKLRAEKEHANPQIGYQAQTQRMVYQQPHQPPVVLQPAPQQEVLRQPMVQQQSTGPLA
jgi:Cys-rich protein (TIGR01571 family)